MEGAEEVHEVNMVTGPHGSLEFVHYWEKIGRFSIKSILKKLISWKDLALTEMSSCFLALI